MKMRTRTNICVDKYTLFEKKRNVRYKTKRGRKVDILGFGKMAPLSVAKGMLKSMNKLFGSEYEYKIFKVYKCRGK
jgi:hypothetical protein